MSDKRGVYKIGVSIYPEDRLKTLRAGNPTLEIVFYEYAFLSLEVESMMRKRFRKQKIKGQKDWYYDLEAGEVTDAIIDAIEETCNFSFAFMENAKKAARKTFKQRFGDD